MAKNSVFRKKSLERISSPEKLDDYIRVSNPSVWVIIASLFILLGGFGYWCLAGSLPTTVSGKGISVHNSQSSKIVDSVVGFVSQDEFNKIKSEINGGKKLSEIEVEVTPRGMSSKYGTVKGKITGIGEKAISVDGIAELVGDNATANSLVPDSGYGVKIDIQLERDTVNSQRLLWSGDNSDGSANLIESTICDFKIILQKESPASFLFS